MEYDIIQRSTAASYGDTNPRGLIFIDFNIDPFLLDIYISIHSLFPINNEQVNC